MKILGLSFGRTGGNSETLLREALWAAMEQGAEAELLRVNDFRVKPCFGCHACGMRLGKKQGFDCVLKDDFPIIYEHYLQCDAYILSVPVSLGSLAGSYRALCDRFSGGTHDVACLDYRGQAEGYGVDPRYMKQRACAFIGVGYEPEAEKRGMVMPQMRLFSHSADTAFVDEMYCGGLLNPGDAAVRPEALSRARELGENLVSETGRAKGDCRWHAEAGSCPTCHGNLFVSSPDGRALECALCAVRGEAELQDGIHVTFTPEERAHMRMQRSEMVKHGKEIDAQMADYRQNRETYLTAVQAYYDLPIPVIRPESGKK